MRSIHPHLDLHVSRRCLKYSLCFLVLALQCSSVEVSAKPSLQSESNTPEATLKKHPKAASKELGIHINKPNGAPLEQLALVTLTKTSGQLYRRGITRSGYIRFRSVERAEYCVQVVSAAYQMAVKRLQSNGKSATEITIELNPAPNSNDAPFVAQRAAVLSRKAQKEFGKALEALRVNAPAKARSHLEAVYRVAPNDADVNYFFGVYSSQSNDWEEAKLYWIKSLQVDPEHFRALLALSDRQLIEHKPAEAAVLARKAIEAEPMSWRGHATLANAYLQQGAPAQAIREAERALELGHEQAKPIESLLAAAIAQAGDNEQMFNISQTQPTEPLDAAAQRPFANPKAAGQLSRLSLTASSSFVPSTWLPSDIDEKVPPVDSDDSCVIDDVIHKAGERILEFVANVDRFTATESIAHQSINKWGGVSYIEKRTFDYLVSISEIRPGFFDVEEYRTAHTSPAEFSDGVETRGLPSMALLFHPKIAENYEITCEGLARSSRGLAWQVHFRQRPDRPNIMRSYRVGINGTAFPVALRGRAWIAADTYQILRMETDLVAPLPEIRLITDHTAIEYGAVHFRDRQVAMWLPLTAEVYYDWRGRRAHRRHTFSNYLLFSVDEKQRISPPKSAETLPAKALSE
jgi:tetratricopeptide (TPR) repeat protein